MEMIHGMTCSKVDTGQPNLRCPNSEQQMYLNSNAAMFPTYTWASDASAWRGLPFHKKVWHGLLFHEKVWYGLLFHKNPIQ